MKEIQLNTKYKHQKNYMKFKALVSDEDFERVSQYNWCVDIKPTVTYAVAKIDGKNTFLHRFLTDAPKGMEVDHISSDGLDCQRGNLRIVTHQQNCFNSRSIPNTSSQYKGVSWFKSHSKWGVTIRKIHLGFFDNEEEAALVYNEHASLHYGEFARLNVVPGRQVA